MNVKLFLGLLVYVALTAAYEEEWENHKKIHNMKFHNHTHHDHRKHLFKKIHDHIKNHKKSHHSKYYNVTHNKFSTMTDEEKGRHLGLITPPSYLFSNVSGPSDRVAKEGTVSSDSTLRELRTIVPSSVDWSKDPCMTSMFYSDQGSTCGSCWAFAATSVFEFNSCVKTGVSVPLSQQQLIDCTDSDPKIDGCKGGYTPWAWQYIAKVGGQVTYNSYPYTAKDGQCQFVKENVGAALAAKNQQDAVTYIAAYDINTMKSILANKQIFAASINSISNGFYQYSSGVFSGPCLPAAIPGGHIFAVVGYGTQNGVDYWVIRNSWGPRWGMGGYGLFQRGINLCGIEGGSGAPSIYTTTGAIPVPAPPAIPVTNPPTVITTTTVAPRPPPGGASIGPWQLSSDGAFLLSSNCSFYTPGRELKDSTIERCKTIVLLKTSNVKGPFTFDNNVCIFLGPTATNIKPDYKAGSVCAKLASSP